MKVYFQIQSGRKLRVYRIIHLDEAAKKRRQETLAVLSVEEPLPLELLDQLSADDKLRLVDMFDLLRSQVNYERVRDALNELPPLLENATALLAAGRLTLGDDQKEELRATVSLFLQQLTSGSEAPSLIC